VNQKEKLLVVMIPCFNEEKTIGQVIDRIPRKIRGISKTKVLVINDGSSDCSAAIARKHGAIVISHPINRGLGQTFVDGIDKALRLGADIIVNIDGDLQFNPKDIPKLVKPIIEEHFNFVTGTRYKDHREYNMKNRGLKNWGNKVFVRIINWITGHNYTDVSCGFRAYSRKAALKLQLFGHFTYTHETFLDLVHKGFIACEVPVKVRPLRQNGQSHVSGNLFKYAYSALKIIGRSFRDYHPFKFFGSISLIVFLVGLIPIVIFFVHYFTTGRMSPFKSYAIGGAFLLVMSFLIFMLALLADMMGRIKDLEEEIIYQIKRKNK